MSNEQIKTKIESYLIQLEEKQDIIISAHEKFQVALAGTLKIIGNESPTLTHLKGSQADLKGYLIRLNSDLFDTTKRAFEDLNKHIKSLLESV